jgi:Raf kinase inhibitor-like YbhB/YbcL family protein
MRMLLPLLLLVGCGDDGGSGMPAIDAPTGNGDATVDSPIDGPVGGAFTVTSTTITEGMPIPATHACAPGANTSPALAWTGAPGGALSFAVILTDKSNGLIHAIIYDIPGSTSSLPANVEKAYAPANVPGAHQTASYSAAVRGYNGPCPPPADPAHTYEFALFALDVATLPGATMSTTRAQAAPLITQHMLSTTSLSGTYDR